MALSPRESQRKQDAYAHGKSDDLTGLPEPTVERLKAARAEREELHKAYEEAQAWLAEEREAMTKARYLAAGNSESDWQRDRDRVLGDEATARMRAKQGGALISPAEFLD